MCLWVCTHLFFSFTFCLDIPLPHPRLDLKNLFSKVFKAQQLPKKEKLLQCHECRVRLITANGYSYHCPGWIAVVKIFAS